MTLRKIGDLFLKEERLPEDLIKCWKHFALPSFYEDARSAERIVRLNDVFIRFFQVLTFLSLGLFALVWHPHPALSDSVVLVLESALGITVSLWVLILVVMAVNLVRLFRLSSSPGEMENIRQHLVQLNYELNPSQMLEVSRENSAIQDLPEPYNPESSFPTAGWIFAKVNDIMKQAEYLLVQRAVKVFEAELKILQFATERNIEGHEALILIRKHQRKRFKQMHVIFLAFDLVNSSGVYYDMAFESLTPEQKRILRPDAEVSDSVVASS